LFALLLSPCFGQVLTNLGSITINTSLVWDKNQEPDIFGYYVYAAPATNPAAIYRVATVTNGISAASLIGTNANGSYVIWATAVNSAGIESEPSAAYAVEFARTNIVAPKNLQFFLYTVATNLIPLQQLKDE
jgi:hypothetical protein